MSSYLSHKFNSAFCAPTAAPELQIRISILRGKIVQNMKFSLVSQNSYLNSKLDSTCQNKSGHMFSFQNRVPKAFKLKLHAKRCNMITSKNVLFNYNSFGKSKTTTRFVSSKRLQKWSRFLVSSLGQSCTKNKKKL